MWTVVYISQNDTLANELAQIFEQAGILAKIRTVAEETGGCSYEILVPDAEVEQAHNLILERE